MNHHYYLVCLMIPDYPGSSLLVGDHGRKTAKSIYLHKQILSLLLPLAPLPNLFIIMWSHLSLSSFEWLTSLRNTGCTILIYWQRFLIFWHASYTSISPSCVLVLPVLHSTIGPSLDITKLLDTSSFLTLPHLFSDTDPSNYSSSLKQFQTAPPHPSSYHQSFIF